MAREQTLYICVFLAIFCLARSELVTPIAPANTADRDSHQPSGLAAAPVRKEEHTKELHGEPPEEDVVIVSEKSLSELQAERQDDSPDSVKKELPNETLDYVQTKHLVPDDDDLPESLSGGFYFFFGISMGAVLFIIFKVYKLRTPRAERRYGVQGDRATQELTPLPTSIEDGNSDDDDQTLFEVHRHQIRIL